MKELAQLIGVGLLAMLLLSLEEVRLHQEAAENERKAGGTLDRRD